MQKGANAGVKNTRLKLGGQNPTIRKSGGSKLQFSLLHLVFLNSNSAYLY
jgi:hypothetical protein